MIESLGLTGNWGWTFATHTQIWSPGLFNILGLEVGSVRPDYDYMLGLVHPDDRAGLESAGEIMRSGVFSDRTFRIIRRDGTMRVLVSRGEVFHAPDGQPLGAAGVLLDVTDRERFARSCPGGPAPSGVDPAAAPGPAEAEAPPDSVPPIGIEQEIDRRQLRAARALLEWSMADLAQASGLSFSSVRRLEESPDGGTPRSRQAAIAALRAAGIDFSRSPGRAVAVARVA
ncbi:PAS domain-containing protein [Methylobacterium nigriterrae]|uniref:PAS domain-containing protein n=1 Tax=Methylobacterium nigriterrae TaxID=3127512 RepID=UPI00301350B9